VGENDAPRRVLRNMDLQIQKGEYVAFCGPSGCGKSTVLKLLMCLYPLDGGERCLTAAEGEIPLDAGWRGLFAYVPQGNQLMSGSIREVVTFGDREQMVQEERIFRALKIACADQFVSELPDGLDTQLGERGAGLSEGQMQRVAIARAIFSDRPILLLDEATSALDEQTEAKLLDNLRSMTDKTVVIITHRPAALDITDKIITFTPDEE
jgi:ATP-binding cassette subfamily B protein